MEAIREALAGEHDAEEVACELSACLTADWSATVEGYKATVKGLEREAAARRVKHGALDIVARLDAGETPDKVAGALSDLVAFTRPDQGSNFVGGPVEPGAPDEILIQPLGVFVNTAVGNAFENQPGPASGKNTYMSSEGTYGNQLFETQALAAAGALAQGDDLIYTAGQELVASRNGYLQMRVTTQTGAAIKRLGSELVTHGPAHEQRIVCIELTLETHALSRLIDLAIA